MVQAASSPTWGYPHGLSADVVAAIFDDDAAPSVAQAAVIEAVGRGSRLRFVQVISDGLDEAARALAEQSTFRAAVQALRGIRGIPCRFEIVVGDPLPALVDLSRSAAAVVLGQDRAGRRIAAQLSTQSVCPVLTVGAHSAA